MTTILAPGYTPGRPRSPNVVVLHTTENWQGTPAANVARYFVTSGVQASCHRIIDDTDIVVSVYDENTAWHAAAANPWTLGIEQVGRAAQTVDEWNNDYALRQRVLVRRQLNEWSAKYGIRLVRLSNAELFAAATNPAITGVVGHNQVTEVFPQGNDGHWDPGPAYPYSAILDTTPEEGHDMYYIRNATTGAIYIIAGIYKYPTNSNQWNILVKAGAQYVNLSNDEFNTALAAFPDPPKASVDTQAIATAVAAKIGTVQVNINDLARAIVVELGKQ